MTVTYTIITKVDGHKLPTVNTNDLVGALKGLVSQQLRQKNA